jgi:hypothetical protein
MIKKNYLTGTEPNQPAQKPQEGTELPTTGISGTTHGGKRTTQERARAHVETIKVLIRG